MVASVLNSPCRMPGALASWLLSWMAPPPLPLPPVPLGPSLLHGCMRCQLKTLAGNVWSCCVLCEVLPCCESAADNRTDGRQAWCCSCSWLLPAFLHPGMAPLITCADVIGSFAFSPSSASALRVKGMAGNLSLMMASTAREACKAQRATRRISAQDLGMQWCQPAGSHLMPRLCH